MRLLASACMVLLALLAWWAWHVMPIQADGHAARATTDAHVRARSAADGASGATRPDANIRPVAQAMPAGSGNEATATARCLAERDRQLAIIHEGLDPDRSPAAAFDRALLADVLALPTGAGDSHRRNARAVQARWQAARRRWPRDLDLAWFAARNCSKSLGCDSDGALQHLLEVDPGNAAAWVMAMEAALEDGDAGAYDRALQRAAAARTYDTRSGVAYLRLQPLLSLVRRPAECLGTSSLGEAEKLLGRPLKDDDLAALEALALEYALGMPSYSAFSGCGGRAVARSPSRQPACIAVLSRLADGDTLIEQNIALPKLIELTRDTPENVRLRERYRRMLWLWQFADAPLAPGSGIAQILARGEIANLRDRAIAQHRWPPPADWLPESGRARALILAGESSAGHD
jgi:hypothetical protein